MGGAEELEHRVPGCVRARLENSPRGWYIGESGGWHTSWIKAWGVCGTIVICDFLEKGAPEVPGK